MQRLAKNLGDKITKNLFQQHTHFHGKNTYAV